MRQKINKNIEHIFIDGGSKDKTVDIINNSSKREKIIVSEKDKGLYDAMNKGIDLAKGEWIYFMGSDDALFDSGVLLKVVNELKNNKF